MYMEMKLENIIKQVISEQLTPGLLLKKMFNNLGKKGAAEAESALIRAVRKENNLGPKVSVDVFNLSDEMLGKAIKSAEYKVYRDALVQKTYNKNQQLFDDIIANSTGKKRVMDLNNAGIHPAFQSDLKNLSNLRRKPPTPTPNSQTPTPSAGNIITKEEQMQIIAPIIDQQLKTFKVPIPRGFRDLFMEEVVKISEKEIKDALPKIEGKGEKFTEWFNKLTISEKQKIFNEVQSQTLKLKNLDMNFLKRFWEYLTFFKDRKGTFISKEDYSKAYKYAMIASGVSIAMDGLRALYNSKNDQEFQGRFFDIFGTKGNWIAYGAKFASYLYAPAAIVVNTVIAIDSIFEYFVNVGFREVGTKRKPGESGVFDDSDLKNNDSNKSALDGIKDN